MRAQFIAVLGTAIAFSIPSDVYPQSGGLNVQSCFWYATAAQLRQVDGVTGALRRSVESSSTRPLIAKDDCALWSVKGSNLLHHGADGAQIKTTKLSYLDSALTGIDAAAINNIDGSFWIAQGTRLVRLNKTGGVLEATSLSNAAFRLAADFNETLWVAANGHLFRYRNNAPVSDFILPTNVGNPTGLAVDSVRNKVWLTGTRRVIQFNREQPDTLQGVVTLPEDIKSFALDSDNGEAWIATTNSIYVYATGKQQLPTIDLLPHQISAPTLSYDPLGKFMWARTSDKLLKFDRNGNLVATVLTPEGNTGFATAAFRVTPKLTILAPSPGAIGSDPLQPIRVRYDALCSGTPCSVGNSYVNAFTLSAKLNDKGIAGGFQIENGQIRVYTPRTALPEGPNLFTGTLTDAFKQKSAAAESSFVVDLSAPTLVNLSPPDGANLPQQAVTTITGNTDEPASVSFDNRDEFVGIGAITQNAPFSWNATLRPGANRLQLTSTDIAGNARTQTITLNMAFSTIAFDIESPVAGAQIASDSVLVRGALMIDAAVGITVNGVAAELSGQQFQAVVPLVQGTNDITVTATSPNGITSSKTIRVNAQLPEIQIQAHPNPTIVGRPAKFTLTMNATPKLVEVDYNGDGTFDQNSLDPNAVFAHVYYQAGTYQAKFRVTNQQDQTSERTVTVVVVDYSAVDGRIRRVYQEMVAQLRAGNVNSAKSYFTSGSADQYGQVFTALGTGLVSAANNLGTLAEGMVGEDFAEYTLVRNGPDGPEIFLVYFLRGSDGLWRIDSM